MKRHEALKTLAIASGDLITLPSRALRWNADSLPSGTSFFKSDEQALLSAVTDTIIPGNEDPGALSVGVDKFFVRLIERCYEKDVRENVRKRLKTLDNSARKTSGRSFPDCSRRQREELLLAFSESDNEADMDFFNLIKAETVRGFRTSQVVMENYLGYQLMPDHYARIIFVNASALGSNAILLNSISKRFPNGLGNDNGLLGKYVSWHNYHGRAGASVEGFEDKMTGDYVEQSKEMFEIAGFININAEDTQSSPGADIHEMGGVRMGYDPKTSLLNRWNQFHKAKNVFVTDGACMTSTGTQNPTLTYMAITARAASHAAEELKKGNL